MNITQTFKRFLALPLVKNTLKLSSSSALMMFLPLVVTPILSRLYTPEDYGYWGIFSSVSYIVGSFIFLSYENTIVKSSHDDEIPNLFTLCLMVMTIILSLVIMVFVIGSSLGFSFFCDFPSLPLLITGLGMTGLFNLLNNLANRHMKYNAMAITGIVNGISQALLRILLGFFPIIAYGLIVGNVVAQVLSVAMLLYFLKVFISLDFFNKIRWQEIKKLAIKYKKFPIFDAPARFIEFAVGNLAIIILSYFWGKSEVGCFSMVMQFVLMPIAIIGSAMGNIYYKEISEAAKDDNKLAATTKRVAKITFVMSVVPILFLALGGDYLFVLFLGDKWTTAGPMALCMSVFSVPVILSEPILPVFRSLDKQETRFRLNLYNLGFSLGLLVLVAAISHNLYLSLLCYSTSYAFTRFLMFHHELKLCNLVAKDISQQLVICYIITYVLVIARIIPYL